MTKDFIYQLINLGKELSDQQDSAHDLWTWLPSYKVAEKNHGDYASNFTPNTRDIIIEATMLLAYLKGKAPRDYNEEELEWFNRCPCGEDHNGMP